ncbi:MAG: hypothetical protein HGA82_03285 [Anaerolineales bacterium]|nr:hypothetical protein [Anaerolineales bacterium]
MISVETTGRSPLPIDELLDLTLQIADALETANGKSFLFFTASNKTSDFVADGIDLWWTLSKERLVAVKRIIINLDNGPECSGHRSQFLKRMVAFADRENKEVRLIPPPAPFHRKTMKTISQPFQHLRACRFAHGPDGGNPPELSPATASSGHPTPSGVLRPHPRRTGTAPGDPPGPS